MDPQASSEPERTGETEKREIRLPAKDLYRDPVIQDPEKYLRQLVDTVKAQTYPNWELCLSDGSGADSPIAGLLKELAASDERIKVVSHNQQLQISGNTNAGIEIATGITSLLQIMTMN